LSGKCRLTDKQEVLSFGFRLSPHSSIIYSQFMAMIDDDFWPGSLIHLTKSYLHESSQYVTIGEISGEPINNYPGTRLLYAAMVPADEADECLARPGGIGHGISHINEQIADEAAGGNPTAAFWVESRRPDHKRYQSLVESWQVHDRHILLPFADILESAQRSTGDSRARQKILTIGEQVRGAASRRPATRGRVHPA
jgi:hypothetical protein